MVIFGAQRNITIRPKIGVGWVVMVRGDRGGGTPNPYLVVPHFQGNKKRICRAQTRGLSVNPIQPFMIDQLFKFKRFPFQSDLAYTLENYTTFSYPAI